jgi:hypothetical protein
VSPWVDGANAPFYPWRCRTYPGKSEPDRGRRPHGTAFHELVEFDAPENHVDDARQNLRDYPSDYEDNQENHNLRNRVHHGVE